MSDYQIDKGIPLPPIAPVKYPFSKMEVGDSILDTKATTPNKSKMRQAAVAFGKLHNQQFASRVHKGGVRIWRTA